MLIVSREKLGPCLNVPGLELGRGVNAPGLELGRSVNATGVKGMFTTGPGIGIHN